MMISLHHFRERMNTDGYVLIENFIKQPLIEKTLDDLKRAYLLCQKIQIRNKVENSEGTCHHLIGHGQSFMNCLAAFEKLNPYLEDYFEGKYILNSFGGNLLKATNSYANAIHRDQRSYSGKFNLMLNTIVMLDDFTEDNGATWLCPGGHKLAEKPKEDIFRFNAIQAIAPSGSIMMFNSNMWHCAGENRTDRARRSVTPIFSRCFVKQGMDYPRVLGYHMGDEYTDYLQQVLGYNSRVPAGLEQWYQPVEKRYYRGGQG